MDLFSFSVLSINIAFVVRHSCLPPLSFQALKESRQWIPWGHIIRAVVLFEHRVCGSPHVRGLWGLSCSKLSGCPHLHPWPPSAAMPLHLLTFAGLHLTSSPLHPLRITWKPLTRKTMRDLGLCFPLCPRSQGSATTPASPVTRGTPRRPPAAEEPSASGAAKSILSWLQTKMKEKNFSCPWFFLPNLSSFSTEASLATTLNSSEAYFSICAWRWVCFCVSPPHTRAQTELPVHPELSLPCVPLPACFSST